MVPQRNGHFNVIDTLPKKTPDARKVWINFVPNVDLGHILTMIGFASALAVTWNIQDRRITLAEQKLLQAEQTNAELKIDVKEIKSTLTQIQTTLAVQSYITNQSSRKN